ncbi:MAG: rRNA pseudouridine synthase [Ruminococcaceae bacterium]|nr:rRNA pseudouridine synthase [Oscillospiraceae bacterium]
MEERLQKLIASAGICSRRAAEAMITAGRVQINGRTAQLGEKADLLRDTVMVDGRVVGRQTEYVYVMLNKPRGYVTTLSDEKGRATVADLTRDVGERVFPVGRLDLQSEGLLLMTNDGALMQKLIHPSFEVSKTYAVIVAGEISGALQRLRTIRDLDGEPIRPAQVELLRQGKETAEMLITIHEGKNRQIRRMCQQCGLSVKRLCRIAEHSLILGDLPVGKWRYLTVDEISALTGKEL